jgi:hypothetical protein
MLQGVLQTAQGARVLTLGGVDLAQVALKFRATGRV